MRLSTIARNVYQELSKDNSKILLEKENFQCLEHVLESETKKLCSRGDLDAINNEKRIYSKGQLGEWLSDAKSFVDGLTGLSADAPGIGYFSVWDKDLFSMLVLTHYAMSGILAALIIPSFVFNPLAGLAVNAAGLIEFGIAKHLHNNFKGAEYFPFSEKVVVEPCSPYIIQEMIVHEYSHHILRKNKIFMKDIEEGFALNIQKHYGVHLSEQNHDEKYTYHPAWEFCNELNEAYSWACMKLGKKAAAFEPLKPVECKKPYSDSLGCALLRIAEEKEGINASRNLINAHLVSKAFSSLELSK